MNDQVQQMGRAAGGVVGWRALLLAALMAAIPLADVAPALTASHNHPRAKANVGTAAHRHRRKAHPKTVQQTFASDAIAVPVSGTADQFGPADPYPSSILVQGFRRATITDVNLTLRGINHPFPSDLDVLLVAPDGRNAVVLGAVGSGDDAVGLTLTLDDEAPENLPVDAPLRNGSFRPLDVGIVGPDADLTAFPTPAPSPSGQSALAIFDGGDPNGQWHLFVIDDRGDDEGSLDGWSLEITAQDKAKAAHKRHHGGGKKHR